MLTLRYSGWALHEELQIVQADVYLEINGEILIDEPMCVDVGMPALIWSATKNIAPDRFSAPDEWAKMPFFVCGCGDPECRGYGFSIVHEGSIVHWIEVEQNENGAPRELDRHSVELAEHRETVRQAGEQFLMFIEGLDYRPLFADTVRVVKEGMKAL
ncbi:hypothetical protein [Paenibacillus turpanensis]|uniref:hypothetical protein n=1 Tax=Paenibacillus turpanensis TaxID=2689078 RepID=UPI00140C9791|nr:hypothetical protein [Paenibacillus turpanensis]